MKTQDGSCLPPALVQRRQWILWRGQPITRAGVERLNKIPIDPRTQHKASTTDPHTWNLYAYCVEALPVALEDWHAEDPEGYLGGGLGFVFTPEDPFCGLDLDHVRNATTGTIQPWAAQMVRAFHTYTEVSPSGTGLHLIGHGTLGQGLKRSPLELYDRGRYFTMTGAHLPDTPRTLEDVQRPLDWLVASIEVLAKALDRHGERLSHVFAGEWQHSYPSQSEADLSLCTLAVQCGATADQCDALMRLSGLYRPKWDERHGSQTYGQMTISKALAGHQRPRERRAPAPDGDDAGPPLEPEVPWPTLDEAAYHGVVGSIVQAIAPNTEGDPAAVLLHLLVMLGCAIGRVPYYQVEATRHYPNLFVCLVGKTSRARKGTSADYATQLVTRADAGFGARLSGGLSSGEGVIWHVRDAVGAEGEKGYIAGVDDKRLCLLESEFARALAKMSQEGNVLSAILRQAYDHGTLRTLVSGRTHAPVTATGAHIALIAHVTVEELQRLMTETEAANGFGNRILWACVQRARLLPDGAGYPAEHLAPVVDRLQQALHAARRMGRMSRSPEARTLWHRLYPALTEERAGLLGAMTARAEAHTLRLSMLYALLDETETIAPEHLDAAYAVWRYCDDSARYIFGERLGDPIADEILRMVRAAGSQGMTRTDLYNAFGRNVASARIWHALSTLQREQLLRCEQEQTGGRPVERWFAR